MLCFLTSAPVSPVFQTAPDHASYFAFVRPNQTEVPSCAGETWKRGRGQSLLLQESPWYDLTGLPVANASLLDEGTAVGETIGIALIQNWHKNILCNKISFVSQT